MTPNYYNHQTKFARDKRSRGGFLANWWHIFLRDPRWVPPYFPSIRKELEPDRNHHLARMDPIYAHTEALPRRGRSDPYEPNAWLQQGSTPAPIVEIPVAASVVLKDPRRHDATAYLALLRCVNDIDSLEQFFNALFEEARKIGIRWLIGPTHISPHLGSGVLINQWDQVPPLYSPYNPPYLPETIRSIMRPLQSAHLFNIPVPPISETLEKQSARIVPFDPELIKDQYLELMRAACSSWDIFIPPDHEEAAFIYRWTRRWPQYGWMAMVNDRPTGFIFLQPDMAHLLKSTGGGRGLFPRLWLTIRKRKRARKGRVVFAGVHPEMRGRGIGTQLLHQAYFLAQEKNWESLRVGPIPVDSPGEKFLISIGASPQQRYWLYQLEI